MNLSTTKNFTVGAIDEAAFFNESREPRVNIEGVVEMSVRYLETSLVDTTNVSTSTYYPSATGLAVGAYRNLSITGKLIDGVGETTTLTWEATNDEDTANADWVQFYAYNSVTDTTVLNASATNQTTLFAIDFDNINYAFIRFKITTTAATNTVIIKMRRS